MTRLDYRRGPYQSGTAEGVGSDEAVRAYKPLRVEKWHGLFKNGQSFDDAVAEAGEASAAWIAWDKTGRTTYPLERPKRSLGMALMVVDGIEDTNLSHQNEGTKRSVSQEATVMLQGIITTMKYYMAC
jgi:hypothetical protein